MSTRLLLLPGTTLGDLPPDLLASADEVLAVSDITRALRGHGADTDHLVVAGSPPEAEIGAGLAPLFATALRPRRISVFDARTGTIRRLSLPRYLRATLPGGALQLASSAAAVAAQRGAAAFARRAPSQSSRHELGRVLYARPSSPGARVGGAITHTHEVIRALEARGIEVDALTTDPVIAEVAAREDPPPCRWRVVPTGTALRAAPASAAFAADVAVVRAGLASARRADVVYQRHGRFTLGGALLARLAGRPLFLEYNGSERYFHDHWQRTPFLGQLSRCEDAVLAAATRIFVVSELSADELAGRGIDRSRIVVNPNGVDATRFGRGGGAAVRANYSIPDDAVLVGFVGSFGPWHGAPALARAFVAAAATCPTLLLLLVGDGSERAETAAIVEQAGLGARAHFTAAIASSEVPAHLDACDVLVAPHVPLPGGVPFFGSPTKLYEYMAAGKSIAASDLGQIGEVLEHERTALLVEPGNTDDLAGALERLARERALRNRLGAAARVQALERHAWSRNAERIARTYKEL